MTTAAQRQEFVRTANLMDKIVLLDGLWTAELAREIDPGDGSSVIQLGYEIVGLVRDLPGALGPARGWATNERVELGAAVDRALQVGEETLGLRLAAELRRDNPPEKWAAIVLGAVAILDRGAGAEIERLGGKIARLERGELTIGDLGKLAHGALLVLSSVLLCGGPAIILAPAMISAQFGAVAVIGGIVVRLGEGLIGLSERP